MTKKLITRKEAEAITGLDRSILQYYLLRDAIRPVKQVLVKGKAYNFYNLADIEALAKRLPERKVK